MSDAVGTIVQALHNDMDTMRTLAQNIANSETTGYRRSVPVTHTFAVLVTDELAAVPRATPGAPSVREATDLSIGSLRQVSGALNLALEGEGYFVVDTDQGEALTRRGDLKIDAAGFLSTQSGHRLLGRNGAVHLEPGVLNVSADGIVSADDRVLDTLRLVRVDRQAALEPVGADLYRPADPAAIHDAPGSLVRQGFLEGSNVQAVNEMTRAVETLRHFEATERYFRAYDEMTREAISELGKN